MMADLGSGLQQLLRSLGASGVQAARSQRVAEVHVRWKCAVEAVYRDSAPLVLDHTNGVYIMKPEQANDPMAARVPAGKTLLVVYCDDAMIRSDIDARQEMLKIRLNEQGEHVALFSIKPARFDMKARHPFREEAARAAQQAAQAPNQGYQPAPTDPWNPPAQQGQQQSVQPVQLGQQQVDPMKVNQLKALGKPPQEIAALLGVPVEAVTAVTDQAQPQNHGGSEQQLETGEF